MEGGWLGGYMRGRWRDPGLQDLSRHPVSSLLSVSLPVTLLPIGQREKLRPWGTKEAEPGLKPMILGFWMVCSYASIPLLVPTEHSADVTWPRALRTWV